MKIETILNSYAVAVYRRCEQKDYNLNSREYRQMYAFRARILRMFEEQNYLIKLLKEMIESLEEQDA